MTLGLTDQVVGGVLHLRIRDHGGELCGLRKDDVDLTRRLLVARRSYDLWLQALAIGKRPRDPVCMVGETGLHAVVRERLEPFLAAARERSPSGRGLPAHVECDLCAYLDCRVLARGFARVRSPDRGFEQLVAFGCKARSSPSCNARRMEEGRPGQWKT